MMNEGPRTEIPYNACGTTMRLIVRGLENGPQDSLLVNQPGRNLVAYLCKFSLSSERL